MKTIFDKIYVLSLITNKTRQEHIKYQFEDLGIDFEFIYGTDFQNIKYDAQENEINYPNVWAKEYYAKIFINKYADFGCTLTHYNAISFAYHLGYNNVLVIEDDICFIKDKSIIEYYLNNTKRIR